MKASEACKRRTISIVGAFTPLLVPSFSSRGFPDISGIHLNMRDEIFEASLVSAYDLSYGPLAGQDIYCSDVLFIDSGGYEAKLIYDPDEVYNDDRRGRPWSLEDYRTVLDGLSPLSQLVMVSFDHADPSPLMMQVEEARTLFCDYPQYASDFLCKPEDGSLFMNVDDLVKNINEVAAYFSLLGVTEKELGDSLLERCCNLLRIRAALLAADSETPIHVFGCMEPLSIVSYFLCGADVFDGLTWLRLAFSKGLPLYGQVDAILREEWKFRDADLLVARWVRNLRTLRDLNRGMTGYCDTLSLEEFSSWREHLPKVLGLVREAGLEI
ncbi:hypothetical protein [Rubrobacter aplysinae]|uniref:hypothetical protein n=1 Tax=Rubrobacter aplysinae TaxID=909625 RepID=UPI00064C09CE|nr:hypothetical protein [Rubrobacter aplysinae]